MRGPGSSPSWQIQVMFVGYDRQSHDNGRKEKADYLTLSVVRGIMEPKGSMTPMGLDPISSVFRHHDRRCLCFDCVLARNKGILVYKLFGDAQTSRLRWESICDTLWGGN